MDDGSVKYVSGLSGLTQLDLKHSIITDAGLRSFSSGLCGLRELNISFCQHITDRDAGLLSLVSRLPELTRLIMAGCQNITDVTVAKRRSARRSGYG